MKKISNKVIALVTLASWGVILVISLINGFLYGAPPVDTIVPPMVAALIGWFAFLITMYAVIRLLKAPDSYGSAGASDMGSISMQ